MKTIHDEQMQHDSGSITPPQNSRVTLQSYSDFQAHVNLSCNVVKKYCSEINFRQPVSFRQGDHKLFILA